jgi:methyltransferase family protein
MAAESAPASPEPPGHLERLRHAELEPLRAHFAPGARVLELGGGNGYQASVLHSWGCHVTSIDVEARASAAPFHPVRRYDGVTIPFPGRSFDVVFSSNVLEHVPPARLGALCGETRRVLTGAGRAIHLVPSPAWRLWSWLSRYGYLVAVAAGKREGAPAGEPARAPRRSPIVRALIPPPHGEYPTAASELYYYSRRRWSGVFRESGFEVLAATGAGVFYTEFNLCRPLSVAARRRLSRALGSSCHVFVLRPAGPPR